MIVHYMEIHRNSKDCFTPNIETLELGERKLPDSIDDDVFAIMMYDRREVVDGDEKLIGKPFNYSNYYHKGDIISVDEFKKNHTIRTSSSDWINAVTFGHRGFVKYLNRLPQLIHLYGYMNNREIHVDNFTDVVWE